MDLGDDAKVRSLRMNVVSGRKYFNTVPGKRVNITQVNICVCNVRVTEPEG